MRAPIVVFFTAAVLLFAGCNGEDTTSQPLPGQGEGSTSSPTTLTVGSPHNGTVGPNGQSYYKFTAATNGPHTIALTNTQSDLAWRLYATPQFRFPMLTCDGLSRQADEVCATGALNGGSMYYLEVEEREQFAGSYRIAVFPGSGEGSPVAPVMLTVGTPHSAVMPGNGAAFYTFVAGVNSAHTMGSINPQTMVGMTIYSQPDFVTGWMADCSPAVALQNTACSTSPLAATVQYYIRAYNWSSIGGGYTIALSVGAPLGSIDNPAVIAVNGAPFSGNFNGRNEYWVQFTAIASLQHTVTLNGGDEVDLYDPAASTYIGFCGGAGNVVCVTPALVNGAPYFAQVYNWGPNPGPFGVTVTQP